MARFLITATGKDRPGIVASVAKVLFENDCNIEDATMRLLEGQFAIVLVAFSQSMRATDLMKALDPLSDELGLVTSVREMEELTEEVADYRPEGSLWTVSVNGPDRSGIVYEVASLLAGVNGNIVDWTTRVIGERDKPAYSMILVVELPSEVDGQLVAAELERLGQRLGVHVTMQMTDVESL
ncbi:MAG: hypothetical protein M1131_06320 [Actinobacteria bacterium]|jgi:glycine cleavage system transcriptional repressor|nr:hypothetical protein [Actinomycetota bacterium]MCL6095913.1 hypothetical protein [Actinomycetota bacterium]